MKEFENDLKRNVMPGPFRDSKENLRSLQRVYGWSCAGMSTKMRDEESARKET